MRYFIVFYHAQFTSKSTEDQEHTFIWNDHPVKSKSFPNKDKTIKEIKRSRDYTWVHITGIKELNKQDFDDYYK